MGHSIVEQPVPGSLETALQENWNHARHVENLRERYNSFYWFLWAAILSYVGRKGDFGNNIQENKYLFGLLAVMSFAVLLTTLKWNAEFANHMAAVSACARKLRLNGDKNDASSKWNPLPYPEFVGYMGLPLKFPLPLNVSVWLALINCLGLAIAVFLFFFGWTWSLKTSLVFGGLAGFIGVSLCYWMYRTMKKEITNRMSNPSAGDGQRMAAALEKLASSGAFSELSDPSKWQRETRKDRPLPGREDS
jgi:hypothetical protein